MPGGTFYLYTKAPVGAGDVAFANAEDASQYLIREHSVSTVPWDDVGPFLRFSATFESAGDADDDRVLDELDKRLSAAALRFEERSIRPRGSVLPGTPFRTFQAPGACLGCGP